MSLAMATESMLQGAALARTFSSVSEAFSESPVLNGSWADEMDFQDELSETRSRSCTSPGSVASPAPSFPPSPQWLKPTSEFGLSELVLGISSSGRRGVSPARSQCSGMSMSQSSSLGSPSFSDDDSCNWAAEAALVAIFVRLLRDPAMNPHNGSVSLEKLRHFAREEAPETYAAVVGPGAAEGQFPWKAFLGRHRNQLRKVPGTTRRIKVYLTGNFVWQKNDEMLKAGMFVHVAGPGALHQPAVRPGRL